MVSLLNAHAEVNAGIKLTKLKCGGRIAVYGRTELLLLFFFWKQLLDEVWVNKILIGPANEGVSLQQHMLSTMYVFGADQWCETGMKLLLQTLWKTYLVPFSKEHGIYILGQDLIWESKLSNIIFYFSLIKCPMLNIRLPAQFTTTLQYAYILKLGCCCFWISCALLQQRWNIVKDFALNITLTE